MPTTATTHDATPQAAAEPPLEFGGVELPADDGAERARLVVVTYNVRYAVGSFLISGSFARRLGLGRPARRPALVAGHIGTAARALSDVLPATAQGIRVAGEYDREVNRVALCAGAGDAYLGLPDVVAADVYITSDLRHHPASEARENARVSRGPALVDVSHWASEWLWLDVAAQQLRDFLPGVEVTVSDLRTDPWECAVV